MLTYLFIIKILVVVIAVIRCFVWICETWSLTLSISELNVNVSGVGY
jgi:hypothetical protein